MYHHHYTANNNIYLLKTVLEVFKITRAYPTRYLEFVGGAQK